MQSRCKCAELQVVVTAAGESWSWCRGGAEEMQRRCIGSEVQRCRYGGVDEVLQLQRKGW